MVEFGIEAKQSIENITGPKKAIGSKPIILFLGDTWQNDKLYSRIQNILIDTFRGDKADKISLQGLDHVMACTCADGRIYIRLYICNFTKGDGTKVPNVSLTPMGPFLDLTVRRSQMASEDMWKAATSKKKAKT